MIDEVRSIQARKIVTRHDLYQLNFALDVVRE